MRKRSEGWGWVGNVSEIGGGKGEGKGVWGESEVLSRSSSLTLL
jgi:hypothetical protein